MPALEKKIMVRTDVLFMTVCAPTALPLLALRVDSAHIALTACLHSLQTKCINIVCLLSNVWHTARNGEKAEKDKCIPQAEKSLHHR